MMNFYEKPKNDAKPKHRLPFWLVSVVGLLLLIATTAACFSISSSGTLFDLNFSLDNARDATEAALRLSETPICGFNWIYGEDEDRAREIRTALEAAEIAVIYIKVAVDGEDYICHQNGTQTTETLIRFYAPHITIPTAQETTDMLGAKIEAILRAMEPVPFPYTRDIVIFFQTPDGMISSTWQMDYAAAYQALDAGTTGTALYVLGSR